MEHEHQQEPTVFLNARNVADLLGITPQTLNKWRREGKLSERDIRAVRRNRRWYFRKEDIASLLDEDF